MKEKNVNTLGKREKFKLLIMLNIILILTIILIIIIFKFGYAKYIQTHIGSTNVEVSKMICEMEIISGESNETIIHPYCNIKVKNYNSLNNVTQTDVDYKIQVISKDNSELPEYYWKNSDGIEIARNSDVTGSFKYETKDEREYTIVFINSGEQDITRKVEFNLVAVQTTMN